MSNEQKHTPGPWEYVPSTKNHGPYVTTRYGTDVADCYTMTNPRELSVADGGNSQPHHFCGPEADANAQLIAAAPETAAERDRLKEVNAELLEALIRWRRRISSPDGVDMQTLLHMTDAAIAKAKGDA